jgi:hypothetical protein
MGFSTVSLGILVKPNILHRLLDADDDVHWECPREFDYLTELANVERLRPELESIVGRMFELDRNVQDAAFFTELASRTPPLQTRAGRVILSNVAIRFSGFGRLVTVWGNVPESLPSDTLKTALATVLEARGYKYIPEIALEEAYQGHNQHEAQIDTWWSRFFDYV